VCAVEDAGVLSKSVARHVTPPVDANKRRLRAAVVIVGGVRSLLGADDFQLSAVCTGRRAEYPRVTVMWCGLQT
jgi:hypothetical protein